MPIDDRAIAAARAMARKAIRSYAQCGEDIILFHCLSPIEKGFYVDVGCNDPEALSVTKFFYDRGWSGINIDPLPEEIKKYTSKRPRDSNICTAISEKNGALEFYKGGVISTFDPGLAESMGLRAKALQETRTLTEVLDAAAVPREIHFLKVGTGGHEKQVLRGLDLKRYRPWIIILKAVKPATETPSHQEWEYLLLENGYSLLKNDTIDRYYVSDERKYFCVQNYLHAPVQNVYTPEEYALLIAALKKMALASLELKNAPPKGIPEELHADFTCNNSIPVFSDYYDDRISFVQENTPMVYRRTLEALRRKELDYYGQDVLSFYDALDDYSIEGATVLIWGLVGCNCEAMAIWKKAAHVYVVDYNKPLCEHESITVFDHDELEKSGLKFDCAFSFSSFEHDGLGRYGDPLSPFADLKAMQKARKFMKEGGVMFFGVPMGKDALVWNAHRIYGKWRLPRMLDGWNVLDAYSYYRHEDLFAKSNHHIQPLLVLKKSLHMADEKKAILEGCKHAGTILQHGGTRNGKILLQILEMKLEFLSHRG